MHLVCLTSIAMLPLNLLPEAASIQYVAACVLGRDHVWHWISSDKITISHLQKWIKSSDTHLHVGLLLCSCVGFRASLVWSVSYVSKFTSYTSKFCFARNHKRTNLQMNSTFICTKSVACDINQLFAIKNINFYVCVKTKVHNCHARLYIFFNSLIS